MVRNYYFSFSSSSLFISIIIIEDCYSIPALTQAIHYFIVFLQ